MKHQDQIPAFKLETYKDRLINNIDRKLQFGLTLALFFPVVLEALFKASESKGSAEISRNVMVWSLLVVVFVMVFLVFEWRKEKLGIVTLKFINWSFVLTIICFAACILIFGTISDLKAEITNPLVRVGLPLSLLGTFVIPLTSFSVVVLQFFFGEFLLFLRDLKMIQRFLKTKIKPDSRHK